MATLQKRTDFLQNEVASKDPIIKMLKEIQNGFLDSDSKLNFQDKHNMSSNKHKGQFRLEGNFPWKSE